MGTKVIEECAQTLQFFGIWSLFCLRAAHARLITVQRAFYRKTTLTAGGVVTVLLQFWLPYSLKKVGEELA